MIPTHDDFLGCNARWKGEFLGVSYELSWHGCSDYNRTGTWCYYLIVRSEQFYPDDWAKLRLEGEDRQWPEGGSWRRHWDYDKWPDLEPHGGWTFGEMMTYLGRDGKEHELVKVGCDYAHLWDEESGHFESKSLVEADAKRSIQMLVELFPRRRQKCDYSGMYGAEEEFYKAANGKTIHKSQEEKLKGNGPGWSGWLPQGRVATL